LACGKGRHSTYLNQLGFDVLGADLSENSIAEASKTQMTPCILKFMTCVPFEEKYDAIFNFLPALVISKMKRITLQL
jgi:2-polyprenyl-3-methyl-5-hydroxy-6-metoxy-1,4-benzoquinol methylase